MTCKECICYRVCGGYTPTDLDKDIWHYCAQGRQDEIPDIENRCSDFKDKSRFIGLPCEFGQHLWRVTYPYRAEPKVTEFVVKNFRTIGKQHKMQIEVQAVNSPITNWMRIEDFFSTEREAENALRECLANEKL